MDKRSLASYLDLANHEQKSAEEDIKKLCGQVRQYHFHSAFVNPYYVALAKKIIKNRALRESKGGNENNSKRGKKKAKTDDYKIYHRNRPFIRSRNKKSGGGDFNFWGRLH